MNESSSILLLLIIGTWFFTSNRFQAFLQVLKMPSVNTNQSAPGTPPGDPSRPSTPTPTDPNPGAGPKVPPTVKGW